MRKWLKIKVFCISSFILPYPRTRWFCKTGHHFSTTKIKEDELIFRFVYEVAGCNKPMRRLFSVLHGKTLNVGRVQTPNLKMLVDRDTAITSFKKEKYYVVRLSLGARKRQARESAPLMKRKHLKRLAKRRRPFVFPSPARRKPSSRPACSTLRACSGKQTAFSAT